MPQHERRHRFIFRLLAVGVLAGAALTSSPAQAASGIGPLFPEPAWDRKMAPADRFLILTNWNNEAVLDKETGLVWERTPTSFQWESARIYCAGRTTGSRKGWRLPSVHELNSLFDPSAAPGILALPVGHPFNNFPPAFYWSVTLDTTNPNAAWMVDFTGGGAVSTDLTINGHFILCVRGASNEHQY
jgi:hypothetical protein